MVVEKWWKVMTLQLFVAGLALGMGQGTQAVAQEAVVLSSGKAEFQHYCATCHGESGRGDGPMATLWKKQPADLTRLTKKNDGQFPFWGVYKTIDGREQVMAHGTRSMPVWGAHFLVEEGGAPLDEHTVLGRILSLVYYIESIQQKQ
ncbi:MAG: cytochrome c [Candidatus Binatia bacterium]